MREDGSEIIFGKRHAPKILKAFDEIASEVNTKIRMRGISRGLVCIQEDVNRNVLECEKLCCQASTQPDIQKRLAELNEIDSLIKTIWIDIRFMLKQHSLTVGEIGVLSKKTKEAQRQLHAWIDSTKEKQCAVNG